MSKARFGWLLRRTFHWRWGIMGARIMPLKPSRLHVEPWHYPGYTLRRQFANSRIRNIQNRKQLVSFRCLKDQLASGRR